jgi:hypothetical protein
VDFSPVEREESWAVSPAERLRAKFLKGTSWLGEHLEKTKAWMKLPLTMKNVLLPTTAVRPFIAG